MAGSRWCRRRQRDNCMNRAELGPAPDPGAIKARGRLLHAVGYMGSFHEQLGSRTARSGATPCKQAIDIL